MSQGRRPKQQFRAAFGLGLVALGCAGSAGQPDSAAAGSSGNAVSGVAGSSTSVVGSGGTSTEPAAGQAGGGVVGAGVAAGGTATGGVVGAFYCNTERKNLADLPRPIHGNVIACLSARIVVFENLRPDDICRIQSETAQLSLLHNYASDLLLFRSNLRDGKLRILALKLTQCVYVRLIDIAVVEGVAQ